MSDVIPVTHKNMISNIVRELSFFHKLGVFSAYLGSKDKRRRKFEFVVKTQFHFVMFSDCKLWYISSTGPTFKQLYSTNTDYIRQSGPVRQMNDPLLVKFMFSETNCKFLYNR